MKRVLTVILLLSVFGLFAKPNLQPVPETNTDFMDLARDSTDTCFGVDIVISDTVWDCPLPGTIHIGISGGTIPYSFSWKGPNGFSSTLQNVDSLFDQGTYMVNVTDSLGCIGVKNMVFTGCYHSTEELSFKESISIYPNPSTGSFVLKATDVENGNYTLTVRNTIGQEVYSEVFSAFGAISKEIALTNIPKGAYFVVMTNEVGGASVNKLVID